jgi:CelD/BcsL family acetyltransferase involved in cellulose biosynthesis
MGRPAGVTVRIVRNHDELRTLETAWSGLLARSVHSSLFLTWDWMSIWADVNVKPGRLCVVVVQQEGEMVAIAPLWVDHVSCGPVRARLLRFLGTGEACSDHLDLIVQRKQWDEWTRVIWDQLFGMLSTEWDCFEYSDVPAGSCVQRALVDLAEFDPRCPLYEFAGMTVCPYLTLSDSWDGFVSELSKSRRYAVKAARTQLAERGETRANLVTDSGMLAAEMQRLEALNSSIWKERGQAGSFATESFRDFHQRVSARLLERSQLFLCSLTCNDRYLGALYGYVHQGVLHNYIFSAERLEDRKLNVGDALLSYSIEAAIGMGCRELDFLRGAEPYQYLWTTLDRRNLTVRFYNRTLRGALWGACQSGRRGLKLLLAALRPVSRDAQRQAE